MALGINFDYLDLQSILIKFYLQFVCVDTMLLK